MLLDYLEAGLADDDLTARDRKVYEKSRLWLLERFSVAREGDPDLESLRSLPELQELF